MITINVLLKSEGRKEQDYLAFLEDMVQKSRQDDGCLFYDHFRNVKHQNEYIIVENWADDKSVEKHNQTTPFKNILEKIPAYLEEEIVLKSAAAKNFQQKNPLWCNTIEGFLV